MNEEKKSDPGNGRTTREKVMRIGLCSILAVVDSIIGPGGRATDLQDAGGRAFRGKGIKSGDSATKVGTRRWGNCGGTEDGWFAR